MRGRTQNRPLPVPTFLEQSCGLFIAYSVGHEEKKKSGAGGNKSNAQALKHVDVSLSRLEIELALRLGDGDLRLGIRRAIILASMRQ